MIILHGNRYYFPNVNVVIVTKIVHSFVKRSELRLIINDLLTAIFVIYCVTFHKNTPFPLTVRQLSAKILYK